MNKNTYFFWQFKVDVQSGISGITIGVISDSLSDATAEIERLVGRECKAVLVSIGEYWNPTTGYSMVANSLERVYEIEKKE